MHIPSTRQRPRGSAPAQRGISLLELLVGIAVGLLVIAAALGTLIMSRAASATVSDAAQLQQQASYALRVIGLQLRRAGALDPSYDQDRQLFAFENDYTGLSGNQAAVSGSEGASGATDTLVVSTARADMLTQRDCLGEGGESGTSIESTFDVAGGNLRCRGSGSTQPLLANVSDFQVRYRTLTADGSRMLDATAVNSANLWRSVTGVEVCLALQGSESTPDAGAQYRNCAGESVARGSRLQMVFRNFFHLRAQGAST